MARLKDPRKVFELIGMAKVSSSADDAKKLVLLLRDAGVSMNTERLAVACDDVFARLAAQGYQGGRGSCAGDARGWPVVDAQGRLHYITDYDVVVGKKLAGILSGGKAIPKSDAIEDRRHRNREPGQDIIEV